MNLYVFKSSDMNIKKMDLIILASTKLLLKIFKLDKRKGLK